MNQQDENRVQELIDRALAGPLTVNVNGKREKVKEFRDTADVAWTVDQNGVLRGVKKG